MTRYEATGYGRTKDEAYADARKKIDDQHMENPMPVVENAIVGGFFLTRYLYKVGVIFVHWCGYLFMRPVPTLLWTALSLAVAFVCITVIDFFMPSPDPSWVAALVGLCLGVGTFTHLEAGSAFLVEKGQNFYRVLPGPIAAVLMVAVSIVVPSFALYLVFWAVCVGLFGHSITDWQASVDAAAWVYDHGKWIVWALFAMWAVMLVVGLSNRRTAWLQTFRPEALAEDKDAEA